METKHKIVSFPLPEPTTLKMYLFMSCRPPIIACPEKTNKIGSGMLVGTNWATIFSKTITLKLLNGCGDIKQVMIFSYFVQCRLVPIVFGTLPTHIFKSVIIIL